MKRCKKCGELKPLTEFHRATGMADGHRSECKECHRVRMRAWYQANRERAIAEVKRWQQENKDQLHAYRKQYRQRRKMEERDAYLRRTFGIFQADYEELLARQGGGCAICGKRPGKIACTSITTTARARSVASCVSGATTHSASSATTSTCWHGRSST
jgi:hypothetical protein